MDNPYLPPATNPVPGPVGDFLEPILGAAVYPLNLSFKILAFVPQVYLRDSTGRTLLYIRQKLFKFREHVEIFTDESRTIKVAEIRTNKIIDWSATYHFTDAQSGAIGEVRRKGMRSLWRAHYEVFNPGDTQPDFVIKEENPWTKVGDNLVGGIPLVGMFAGYFFNPRYAATNLQGGVVVRLTKKPALWEGKFQIEKFQELPVRQEMNLLLSFLMMLMLERSRG